MQTRQLETPSNSHHIKMQWASNRMLQYVECCCSGLEPIHFFSPPFIASKISQALLEYFGVSSSNVFLFQVSPSQLILQFCLWIVTFGAIYAMVLNMRNRKNNRSHHSLLYFSSISWASLTWMHLILFDFGSYVVLGMVSLEWEITREYQRSPGMARK